MVKKILIPLFFLTTHAFALEGVIQVLEAPLFEEPDNLSEIVQYVRKGKKIYIHSSAEKVTRHDHLRPDKSSDKDTLTDSFDEYTEEFPDPLFNDESFNYENDEQFLITLTKRKRKAYILKKHVRLIFNDGRELNHKMPRYDVTDYRISEPLPDNYPIAKDSGYKGFFILGAGSNSKPSYENNYYTGGSESGLTSIFQAVWSKKTGIDLNDRLYFGGMLSYANSNKSFILDTGNEIHEYWTQAGVGPYLSFDMWKTPKNVWTSFISVTFNFINKVKIEMLTGSDLTRSESRTFEQASFTTHTGLYYKRRHFFSKNLDVMVGFDLTFEPTYSLKTNDSIADQNLWTNGNKIEAGLLADVSFFIGVQAAY
jgi:hypothetical protein